MDKQEKNAEIVALSDNMGKSQICLCADYRGLTVAQLSQLRAEIRKAGCGAKVVKNTLARISAQKAWNASGSSVVAGGADSLTSSGLKKFLDIFEGPTLLVWSYSDPIAPAKVLSKFSKDNEKLSLKGAFFEGDFVDASGIAALSAMPGREELFGQLLRLINAPATNLVRLLNANATQTVRVIDERRKQLEGV